MTGVLLAASPVGALVVVFWALAEVIERRHRRKWDARRAPYAVDHRSPWDERRRP